MLEHQVEACMQLQSCMKVRVTGLHDMTTSAQLMCMERNEFVPVETLLVCHMVSGLRSTNTGSSGDHQSEKLPAAMQGLVSGGPTVSLLFIRRLHQDRGDLHLDQERLPLGGRRC